ncbi:hypothetical protein VY88_19590 [Azospirillum thiophilum]|uniref:Uncharacterized protein n=1 Tax=Azospirillum thiophilum TaxID=528244 RepID=A0AAC8W2J8_9PROT|nr:hypothetical protein [Azospirillum thiophilum]ALG73969.1 hypothetical protein AL072_23325 [Azospirillum thiophilum]KJR63686.1 hypothetical protein VY88_19590 [Azospirillum thiophilum]
MNLREQWMKDPELKAAYEALGPNFRREVELAQQRRGQRTLQGAAIASHNGRTTDRPRRSHAAPGNSARR